MEFKSLKNIETILSADKAVRHCYGSLCAFIAIGCVVLSLNFAEKQREKIYVLDNGKSLMLALSQDMEQNARQRHVNTCDASMSCSSPCRPTNRRLNTTSTAPCRLADRSA